MSGDLAPNISSRDKTLAIVAKNYKKKQKTTDIKVFCSSHILLDSFTLVYFFFLLGKPE